MRDLWKQNSRWFFPGNQHFLTHGFDLIITAGFDAAQSTVNAANTNPGTDFVIIDYSMTSPPSNLLCAVFDVDQASFPCGFLAAWWAYKQNYSNPVAGFVAGPRYLKSASSRWVIPTELPISITCIIKMLFTGLLCKLLFRHPSGAKLADSLLQQNASIVFAFAGKTGNGALYKVKEAGNGLLE